MNKEACCMTEISFLVVMLKNYYGCRERNVRGWKYRYWNCLVSRVKFRSHPASAYQCSKDPSARGDMSGQTATDSWNTLFNTPLTLVVWHRVKFPHQQVSRRFSWQFYLPQRTRGYSKLKKITALQVATTGTKGQRIVFRLSESGIQQLASDSMGAVYQ